MSTRAKTTAQPPARALAPGGRRTRDRRSDRGASGSRRHILDTAARLFRADGYSAVSLRDIAAACGMKAGSLYYHFSSKDEIVAEVLRLGVKHVYDAVRAAVDALPPGTSATGIVGIAIETHLRVFLELQDYTSANVRIFGQVPEAVRRAHIPLRDEYEAWWAWRLRRTLREVGAGRRRDLVLTRFFLFGAMNSTLEWYRPGKKSIQRVGAELTAMLLDGLRGPVQPG